MVMKSGSYDLRACVARLYLTPAAYVVLPMLGENNAEAHARVDDNEL